MNDNVVIAILCFMEYCMKKDLYETGEIDHDQWVEWLKEMINAMDSTAKEVLGIHTEENK